MPIKEIHGMKVLLIQAPMGSYQSVVYPIGLACLARSLDDKHEVQILDANHQEEKKINSLIKMFNPDVIGIGIRNIDNSLSLPAYFYFSYFLAFVKKIRQLSKNSLLIVGGSGFSIFPREVMQSCPEIDFGVQFEAEETLPLLLDNLHNPGQIPGIYYRKDDNLHHTNPGNPPEYEKLREPLRLLNPRIYEDSPYRIGIQTKRGCNHRCLYCNYPYLNGNKIRLRNPISIVDELEHLEKKIGIKSFAFADGIFNEPRQHAEEICEEIIRRRLSLKWTAYYSMRSFDQSFLDLASKAGCKLYEFSPDSLSTHTLKALNKEITIDQIYHVMELFKNSDQLEFIINLMFNVPQTKLRDLIYLLRAIFIWPMKYKSLIWVFATKMRIYPETQLYNQALNEKLITPNDNLFKPTFYNPWPFKIFSFLEPFLYYGRSKNNLRLRLWRFKYWLLYNKIYTNISN
jgi:radical SAM superfamily enzyme YgiQ (UPF0313 family)